MEDVSLGDYPAAAPTVVMSRVLYFDCFSGISGDMLLGALIDAGLPLDDLKRALGTLAVSGYDISASRVLRAGVSATKFIVHEHPAPSTSTERRVASTEHEHPAPAHGTIIIIMSIRTEVFRRSSLIDRSRTSEAGRARAKGALQRLAVAEAITRSSSKCTHESAPSIRHRHRRAVFGLIVWPTHRLSPPNVGADGPFAHGIFPVPAPAT